MNIVYEMLRAQRSQFACDTKLDEKTIVIVQYFRYMDYSFCNECISMCLFNYIYVYYYYKHVDQDMNKYFCE